MAEENEPVVAPEHPLAEEEGRDAERAAGVRLARVRRGQPRGLGVVERRDEAVAVEPGRLGAYLAWRRQGQGEDFRYAAMRRRFGDDFRLVSLVVVFLLQAVLQWIVSWPVQ